MVLQIEFKIGIPDEEGDVLFVTNDGKIMSGYFYKKNGGVFESGCQKIYADEVRGYVFIDDLCF